MKHFLYITGILLLVGSACIRSGESNGQGDPAPQPPDMHTSRIALDWAGTYIGVLPCADCEGIETVLLLREDLSFEMTRKYLGKSDPVFRQSGSFTWDEQGRSIRLEEEHPSGEAKHFQVGENRLFMLDMEGERVRGSLEEHYILHKLPENPSE